jgi:hypothetical protein
VGLEEDRIVPALNFSSITWQKQLRKREKTPQNFIYKHTVDFENVERKKGKKEKRRGEFKRFQASTN